MQSKNVAIIPFASQVHCSDLTFTREVKDCTHTELNVKSIACFKVGGYFLKILLVILRILLRGLDSQSFMFEIGQI